MRTNFNLPRARPVHLGGGVALLAIPVSAVALAAGQADAQSAIQMTISPGQASFGHPVTVNGSGGQATAGRRLALQFAPAGTGSWSTLRTTRAGRAGGFRFRAPARESGQLRVLVAPAGGTTATEASAAAAAAASSPERLSVRAQFDLTRPDRAVSAGSRTTVWGRLLPGVARRWVRLITRRHDGWRVLSGARTGPRGGFRLPVPPLGGGRHWLRVAFGGDRVNRGSLARAGSVAAYQQAVASWYQDGGATACGFHAGYGVANRDLPCGTHVAFRYHGRTVTATVDDRGPYVGGRDFDLNQNTAGALGFSGVDTVQYSTG